MPHCHLIQTKLTPFQEFVAVLAKLRLDTCSLKDLVYRQDVSVTTISRILLMWLAIMDVGLIEERSEPSLGRGIENVVLPGMAVCLCYIEYTEDFTYSMGYGGRLGDFAWIC